MSTFALTFRVDVPLAPGESGSAVSTPASEACRKSLYPSLGLRRHSAAWATITVGTPKADRVIGALADERAAGRAVVGAATLTEVSDRADAAAAPWFLLHTRQIDDFNLWDAYPSCRAGTVPKVHALNQTFVSSAFVARCRADGLKGVSFLQCAKRGRNPGDPWFVALPDRALGRGLDHPWFDRRRWLEDIRFRPDRRTSALNIGQWAFHQCWLRGDAVQDAPLADVLGICPTPPAFTPLGGLQIVTIPRYWAGAFPDADFAYTPWGEDGPNREGKILRFRRLFVSARARAALVEAGLFAEKAFYPIRAITQAESGVEILDSPDHPLPPMYTAAELAVLRDAEQKLATLG